MVDGFATTSSLIANEGRNFETIIRDVYEIAGGSISAKMIDLDMEGC